MMMLHKKKKRKSYRSCSISKETSRNERTNTMSDKRFFHDKKLRGRERRWWRVGGGGKTSKGKMRVSLLATYDALNSFSLCVRIFLRLWREKDVQSSSGCMFSTCAPHDRFKDYKEEAERSTLFEKQQEEDLFLSISFKIFLAFFYPFYAGPASLRFCLSWFTQHTMKISLLVQLTPCSCSYFSTWSPWQTNSKRQLDEEWQAVWERYSVKSVVCDV